MTPSPFIFEVFDSKNTCYEQEIPLARTVGMARVAAMKLSMTYQKVIVYGPNPTPDQRYAFETYEHGNKTEWSYPDGLDRVANGSTITK